MDEKRLPIYGMGPLYGLIILILEGAGIALDYFGILASGEANDQSLKIFLIVIGIIFIIIGAMLWLPAALGKKNIDCYIRDGELCTTGVYSIVRNPCYSGITFILIGVLFFFTNFWLLILPILYWIILTIMLIKTEERWLLEKFGLQYIAYINTVNRCIPWFSKRNKGDKR